MVTTACKHCGAVVVERVHLNAASNFEVETGDPALGGLAGRCKGTLFIETYACGAVQAWGLLDEGFDGRVRGCLIGSKPEKPEGQELEELYEMSTGSILNH